MDLDLEKKECEKEYKDKANDLFNWFTWLLITNFGYLVSYRYKHGNLDPHPKTLLVVGFIFTIASLVMVFFFKCIRVWAADMRLAHLTGRATTKNIEFHLEETNWFIVLSVFALGLFGLSCSSIILYGELK